MQVILNRSLRAVAGLSTRTPLPFVPLWLEMGISPICAIAAGCRARVSVSEVLLFEDLGAPIGAQAAHVLKVNMEQGYTTMD
jgi:hypothetical protein